jgi:hypothetical protein
VAVVAVVQVQLRGDISAGVYGKQDGCLGHLLAVRGYLESSVELVASAADTTSTNRLGFCSVKMSPQSALSSPLLSQLSLG